MNCVVIDSNRDTLGTKNEITFLNIEYSTGFRPKFKVTNEAGDVVYKCKLNPLSNETHSITGAKGKTIIKFRLDRNDDFSSFNIFIISKNDNNKNKEDFYKNDYMDVSVQLCDENNVSQKYQIEYYNKATGDYDIIELVDRTFPKNNVMVFDYKVYNGKQDFNAPLICDAGQSYTFRAKSSITIQPGVEPLFMVILHFCVFILNSYKLTRATSNMNTMVIINSGIALALSN